MFQFQQNFNQSEQLLSPSNVDRKALERYAIEAATFSTEGELGDLEFERNHRGENDVALFDFTSLFAAENASRIVERKGKRILMCLAGDSLLEVGPLPSSPPPLPHLLPPPPSLPSSTHTCIHIVTHALKFFS